MLPFGEVGGAGPPCRGGDCGGGCEVVISRRTDVGGAVFFSEFLLHVSWGWGFTTATFGVPGRGGGGGRSEIFGVGGNLLFSVGSWEGKWVLGCWF